MPRTTKPPAYRLYKRTGQAVVTLNGQDHYLGLHGTAMSRMAYDVLVGEWLANGRRMPAQETSVSVTELAAAYWRFAQGYYRKNGKHTPELDKIRVVLRLVKHLYGRTPTAEFGPLRIKTVRQHLIETGACRLHINQQIGKVKRMFKWGTENELVPPSVYHGLQAVVGLKRGRTEARETEPVTPVPEEYVTATLRHVSRQVRAMIDLQLLTAMRPGEVRIMRGCDIDMAGRIWTYSPSSHKTEHHGIVRTISLGPRAQAVVKPFLKSDTGAYLFSAHEARDERYAELRRKRKSKVQPSQVDRRKRMPKKLPRNHYTREGYREAIQRACDQADTKTKQNKGLPQESERLIPRWSPGRLRHNAATRFRKEYGLEVAQIMLGHQSAEVTQIYAERDEERALSVVAKIG